MNAVNDLLPRAHIYAEPAVEFVHNGTINGFPEYSDMDIF